MNHIKHLYRNELSAKHYSKIFKIKFSMRIKGNGIYKKSQDFVRPLV